MKKCILILGIFCLCCTGMMGQMTHNKPVDKTFAVGLKGGVNLPRMYYYQNPVLMRLPQSNIFTPIGGVFLDVPLTRSIVISPELTYVQRGTDIKYVHQNTEANVHYSISASYIDLRLPLEMCWEIKPYFQPYLLVGAEVGLCMFGKIHIDRDGALDFHPDDLDVSSSNMSLIQAGDSIINVLGDSTISSIQAKELINEVLTAVFNGSNMSLVHAGAFAGVGFRSRVNIANQEVLLKFNVAFHQGFLDSYSYYEKNGTSQAVNVNAYQITGNRLPQGLEITVGIAIPLDDGFYDACSSFSNDRYRRHGNRGHLFGY